MELTNPLRNLYAIPELPAHSPLGVALKMAEEAHAKETRRKPAKVAPVPYITHPVLTFKILRSLGVKDEATLMAALLHDVLESASQDNQNGPYVAHPEKLQQDLLAALEAQNVPNAKKLTKRVLHVVRDELTMPNDVRDAIIDKRFTKLAYQLKRCDEFTYEA